MPVKLMPNTQPRLSLNMHTAKSLLEGVASSLIEQAWFERDWLVSVHYFPPAPKEPESVTMHVFRPQWLNDDGQGIHFEAQFGPKQWAKLEIPLMLHVFHSGTIPGTKIKRMAVTKPLVDGIYDLVSTWPGYSFRVGRYGAQSFSCTLVLAESPANRPDPASLDAALPLSTEKRLQDMISAEISRLCLALGATIDEALNQALGSS